MSGIAAKLVEPEDEKRHLKAVATPATEVRHDLHMTDNVQCACGLERKK